MNLLKRLFNWFRPIRYVPIEMFERPAKPVFSLYSQENTK